MRLITTVGVAAAASCAFATAATFITNPATGHLYALTDTTGTWHEAEAVAVSYGGHLVTVNDAAENAWLVSTFGGTELFWIGFTDEAAEGTWAWISGEAVTYTNWNSGEPNNATDEDWAHINWSVPGGWNDWEAGADYTDATGYVHYKNDSYPTLGIIEVIPEPGHSMMMLGLMSLLGLWVLRRRE